MKSITTFFVVILLSTLTFSQNQIQKGSISLGGGLGFSGYTNNFDTYYTFSIQPSISYFVSDNFEIGINTYFNYSEKAIKTYTIDDNSLIMLEKKYYERSISVGPYANYYLNFNSNSIQPFIGLAYLYDFQNQNLFLFDENHYWEFNKRSIQIQTGINFPINEKISLVPQLQYRFIGESLKKLGEEREFMFVIGLKSFF